MTLRPSIQTLTTLALAFALASCATTSPAEKAAYLHAQDEVQKLDDDPLANQAAAEQLAQARLDLDNANTALKRDDAADVEHWSYLATRAAQTGEAMTAEFRARQQIAQATDLRSRMLLDAQRRRTELAEQQARESEQRAQQAQSQLADLKAQRQDERTQQRIADAQQQAQQQSQQDIDAARQQAQQQIAQAQQQAEQARQQEEQAKQQLQEMQAQETGRGMVIVLGSSLLFATGRDTIEPGALPTLHRIAQFMQEHPKEKLRIEGFTDSRGSDALNDPLSERRADAVGRALESDGVDTTRIETLGRGSSLPVASNETSAGRQQNRRVEIVFSNLEGQFSEQVAGR